MSFTAIVFQSPWWKLYFSVSNLCNTIKILLLAHWILNMWILQCLCSIRHWFGYAVNGKQRRCFILMIGIWADCRGCIKTIIPNSLFFYLERVAWIHFNKLFWSSSSGTCALSWRSSNLFTLSCLGMIIFICTFLWSLMTLSTSTSCHSGKTLLCKETIQCHSLPQDKYWSLTIMQQPSPWDALSEKRLTVQDRSRRNRFDQRVWKNQALYSFEFSMTNCVIGVQLNSQEMAPSVNASY